MRRALLTITALLSVVVLPRGALSAERFILRASPGAIEQVCADHDLRVVRYVGRKHLVLVEANGSVDVAALTRNIQADSRVYDFEVARRRKALADPPLPSLSGSPAEPVDRTSVEFFGSSAWAGYVGQPAVARVGASATRASGDTGEGVVVAIIDTGVDLEHPLLSGALLPGYDAILGTAGGSETAALEQSGATIQQSGATIQQSGATIQQSGATIQQSGATIQGEPPVPAGYGHGTMVAGLVRLIAPEARILPIRAFSLDGTAADADIIEAIYYAVDQGAKVINMSFSSDSREVKRAIQYATNRGVLCIAAAGNQGEEAIVFPAALRRVLGVAATTLDDARASFSNYGPRLVSVAAPGENLLTTYPAGRYALVSGTSFSTAIVSGAAAILAGAQPGMDYADAMDAFHYSLFLGRDLGFGRIDIPSALSAVQAQVWLKPKRGWAPRAEEDES